MELDNTWASAFYFKPFRHGVDILIQAATKYIAGHADAMLGAIAVTEDLVRALVLEAGDWGSVRHRRDVIWVRTSKYARSGIARWLEQRPEAARVLQAPLPSHPQHALWKRDLGAAGLFSIILKPCAKPATAAMLGRNASAFRHDPEAGGPTVRLHIGLEDIGDLKADLDAGLARLKAAG